ncbi:hypothetical protein AB2S62_00815 [Vibrio sp. NTOU-M3]|uniref:hypothetical protein n=1 Tax=Vibrio sp. NTOU-M3 TaxID=3234954 RepID=UPI0035A8DE0F
MQIDTYKLRVIITFLGCCITSLVLFSPGSITSVIGPSGSILSLLLIFLIVLFGCNKGNHSLYLSSKDTKVVLFIFVFFLFSMLITIWQTFTYMGDAGNFFDLLKFTNILSPFLFVALMPWSDISILDKYISKAFLFYLALTIMLIFVQNIIPELPFWRFISESVHYKYLHSRPFGLSGSPTQTAFVILFISFFFFVRKKYHLFLLSGVILFLVQNKITILVFVISIIYILLSSKLSYIGKILLILFFMSLVFYIASVSSDLASFVFDNKRLLESNTYTHRMDLMSFIFNEMQDWHFFLLGLPDKDFWIEEFGAFDMMYALVIFRFGVLFFVLFLVVLFYISIGIFEGRSKVICALFIFGTSFTMIGLFHSRYGILCSWVIALSLWYISYNRIKHY